VQARRVFAAHSIDDNVAPRCLAVGNYDGDDNLQPQLLAEAHVKDEMEAEACPRYAARVR
jgi:hypothetical protein